MRIIYIPIVLTLIFFKSWFFYAVALKAQRFAYQIEKQANPGPSVILDSQIIYYIFIQQDNKEFNIT